LFDTFSLTDAVYASGYLPYSFSSPIGEQNLPLGLTESLIPFYW